jgi:hypothetical protein
MGIVFTAKLADHDRLRCALWLLFSHLALEVTSFPRVQSGFA